MNVKLVDKKVSEVSADLVFVPVLEGAELDGAVKSLSRSVRTALAARIEKTGYVGKTGVVLRLQTDDADFVLVGLGEDGGLEDWRRAAAAVQPVAKTIKAKRLALGLGRRQELDESIEAFLEAFYLNGYRFDKYRKKAKDFYGGPKSLTIAGAAVGNRKADRDMLARVAALAEGVGMARDLVNEMPSVATPRYLVRQARKVARDGGLRCEVWQGPRLVKEKMNGILAVAAGSQEPGALIQLTYKPKRKARRRIAVVGKGITFDSGGLSLKPGKAMETMKLDMAGAAAVLGLMQVLPAFQPDIEVTGYIATAENMPSGTAQKPGDIIRYRNGTTAEVLNTDAEGRLVLADALCVAVEQKPDAVIDLATLTGACMVALGTRVAGVLGNDQPLIDALLAAGEGVGEDLWQLPLVEAYADDIRSSVADIKNIGGGYGGTITAALFLKAFVGDANWAHLDIAGPAFIEGPLPYRPRGGTGFGVRTLLAYIRSL